MPLLSIAKMLVILGSNKYVKRLKGVVWEGKVDMWETSVDLEISEE